VSRESPFDDFFFVFIRSNPKSTNSEFDVCCRLNPVFAPTMPPRRKDASVSPALGRKRKKTSDAAVAAAEQKGKSKGIAKAGGAKPLSGASKGSGKQKAAAPKQGNSKAIAQKKAPPAIAQKKAPPAKRKANVQTIPKRLDSKKPAAKPQSRGISKKLPSHAKQGTLRAGKPAAKANTKPAAKKPLDPAPGLRRNTTLQTRGKEEAGGLRPKSRSGSAPALAQPVSRAAAAKRPAPAHKSVGEAVPRTNKRAKAAPQSALATSAPVATKSDKCAKTAPPSTVAKSAAAAPKSDKHAKAAQQSAAAAPKSEPSATKARTSLGRAAAVSAAGGKARAEEKGKAPAGSTGSGASSSNQASSSWSPRVAKGPGGAAAPAAAAPAVAAPAAVAVVVQRPLPLQDVKKYYQYSNQGSKKSALDMSEVLGDRREKVSICVQIVYRIVVSLRRRAGMFEEACHVHGFEVECIEEACHVHGGMPAQRYLCDMGSENCTRY